MKVKIKVPTSLRDIKLSQYQKFVRTTKDSEDDYFIARQMVGIFCNIPDNVVDQIVAKDFNQIVEDISAILKTKAEFKTRIKHNDKQLGFIPNLDEITVGEKADLDAFYKDVSTWDKAMGVLYREVEHETKRGYLVKPYTEINVSLDLTLDVVFGANVFFYNLMKDLLSYTQSCIKVQAVKNPKLLQTLGKNGDGITAFMNSLEEIFLNLTQLANLNYQRL